MTKENLLINCIGHLREDDFSEALEMADELVKNYPKWSGGYYWRAKCYRGILQQDIEKFRERNKRGTPWEQLLHDAKMINTEISQEKIKSSTKKIVGNYVQAIRFAPQDEETFLELLDFFDDTNIYHTYGEKDVFLLLKQICENYYPSQIYLWDAVIELAYSSEVEAIDNPEISGILLEFSEKMIENIKKQYKVYSLKFVKWEAEYLRDMQADDYDYLINALFALRYILDKKGIVKKLEKVMWEIVLTSFYNDKDFIDKMDWLDVIGSYCDSRKFISKIEEAAKSENLENVEKEVSEFYAELDKHSKRTGLSKNESMREWKQYNRSISEFKSVVGTLIYERLWDKYGGEWWEKGIPSETKKKVRKHIHKEHPHDFKDVYVGLYKDIIFGERGQNWPLFKDVFPSKTWIQEKFPMLKNARVDSSHKKRIWSDDELRKLDDIIEKVVQYTKEERKK